MPCQLKLHPGDWAIPGHMQCNNLWLFWSTQCWVSMGKVDCQYDQCQQTKQQLLTNGMLEKDFEKKHIAYLSLPSTTTLLPPLTSKFSANSLITSLLLT